MRLAHLAAASVVLLFAQRTAAQRHDFSNVCAVGATGRACSNVYAWNENDPLTGQLYLYLRFANIQGWRGFEDVQVSGIMSWTITNLDLVNPPPVPDPSPGPRGLEARINWYSGYGMLSGNTFFCANVESLNGCRPISEWQVGGDGVEIGRIGSRYDIFNFLWGGHEPLYGCGGAVQGDFGIGTCNGWVTWRVHGGDGVGLRLTNETQLSLVYHAEEGSYRCTTGVDCVTVTPEPGTLLLLGTGLAALAARRTRRRPPRSAR